ncbi:MAG: hypothetical protein ABIT38_00505 [Gemmatimonadaceae bacterium]
MASKNSKSGTGKGHADVRQGMPGGGHDKGEAGSSKTQSAKKSRGKYGSTGSKSSGGTGSSQGSGGGQGGTRG